MSIQKKRPKMWVVMTTPMIVQFFMRPHFQVLRQHFSLTVVANEDCRQLLDAYDLQDVEQIVIPLVREINLKQDLLATYKLWRLLLAAKIDVLWSVAPKAGIVGMLAGWLARVPFRCHIFQGEVWATAQGMKRTLLRSIDRLIAWFASETLVVSASERDFLVREGILRTQHAKVVGNGSICGVNRQRFKPDAEVRSKMREQLAIPEDMPVVLYVGRLKRDKGVLDLVAAWLKVRASGPRSVLAIVGPDEEQIVARIHDMCDESVRADLRIEGLSHQPEHWVAMADVLCLPSYREGFGNVLIEASSAGLPVVATRIYGIEDAMREAQTGLSFERGNIEELAACLRRLLDDPDLRARLGAAGQAFVAEKFDSERVVLAYCQYFLQHIANR